MNIVMKGLFGCTSAAVLKAVSTSRRLWTEDLTPIRMCSSANKCSMPSGIAPLHLSHISRPSSRRLGITPASNSMHIVASSPSSEKSLRSSRIGNNPVQAMAAPLSLVICVTQRHSSTREGSFPTTLTSSVDKCSTYKDRLPRQ